MRSSGQWAVGSVQSAVGGRQPVAAIRPNALPTADCRLPTAEFTNV